MGWNTRSSRLCGQSEEKAIGAFESLTGDAGGRARKIRASALRRADDFQKAAPQLWKELSLSQLACLKRDW